MTTMTDETDILLVGGGTASTAAAAEIRKQGFTGTVTMLTRELDPPYHRPAVSKELLGADGAQHPIKLVPDEWWDEQQVRLHTRAAVTALDPDGHTVTLADKTRLRYGTALLATGANVRRLQLPGASLSGVHYLRAPGNSAKLRGELDDVEHAVLVGGSFIATEVAAALTERGVQCTMIMPESGPLINAVGPAVSAHVSCLLTRHGVRLVCGDQIAEFLGEDRVRQVRTDSGRVEPADLVVVGVGATPDTRLAAKSGLEIGASGGVACDATLRTSAPDLFAAGDVCEYDSLVHGRRLRVEHDQHAAAQGATAAHGLLGQAVAHREVPYFWTDISDWVRLECVGPAGNWDRERIDGSLENNDFTVWYERDGSVVAALTSNRPHDLATAREIMSMNTRS